MDRIEDRRGEEALDRQAWLKAYRLARRREKRGCTVKPVAGLDLAARCLMERTVDAQRALARIDLRPRRPLPRRFNWLGEVVA